MATKKYKNCSRSATKRMLSAWKRRESVFSQRANVCRVRYFHQALYFHSLYVAGWSCEQVTFTVLFRGQSLGEFVSINFEGGDKNKLLAVQKKVLGETLLQDDKVWAMGFPEFIMKLAPQ